MHFKSALIAIPGLLFTFAAQADTDRTYVQIIIKACPTLEQTGQDHRPSAVTGYYVDPINQGLIYNNERSPTKEERDRTVEKFGAVEGLKQTIGRLEEYLGNFNDEESK